MAKPRIPTKPAELRDVLKEAYTAIQNTGTWPVTGPPALAVLNASNTLDSVMTQLQQLRAQEDQLVAQLAAAKENGTELMRQIDYTTDGMFGPDGPEKSQFGVPPKKSTAQPSVPLEQVVVQKISAGRFTRSIFLDWDTEEGAGAYQVEAYTDSALTQLVQSATVTASEVTVQNLAQGQQYWFRVCAVRGDERGPWSDIATQVAGL